MAIKYALTYRDVNYIQHRLNIYDDSYIDPVIDDITGRVWVIKPNNDDVLNPIKGTSLRVELDATSSRDFSDLYSEKERVYRCVYLFDNQVKFEGWLNPEGWWESLNSDNWIVSFDVIDGLGYLDGLSYVQSSGLNWTGRQTGIEIITNCLARTGLQMNIYTNVGVRWTGLPSNVDVLNSTEFNSERFYQDETEPMSCLEVLKTTLEVFSACIQQRGGNWIVFRPNELSINASDTYYGYDHTGANITNSQAFDLSEDIGSEGVGTYYNRFVNRNQRLSNLNSLGGYAINYKFGAAQSLVGNNKYFYYDGSAAPGGWTDWSVTTPATGNVFYPPSGSYGFTLYCRTGSPVLEMVSTATVTLNADDVIQFKASVFQSVYPFTVTNSTNARVKFVTGGTTYYMRTDGSWKTNVFTLGISVTGTGRVTQTKESQGVPGTGTLTVEIWTPTGATGTGTIKYEYLEIVNASDEVGNVKGEIHTAQRSSNPSSKIDDPSEVYVGDNYADTYVGAIYEAGTGNNTSEWTRDKVAETKPLLQIACEDRLRMAQRVRKVFSGDVFGYFEPLSVLTLEGVPGVFLPTSYNYNSMASVTSVTAHEILDDEIADIDYSQTTDYGNTVKPKIRG